MVKYIGFYVYHRFYLIWTRPVIATFREAKTTDNPQSVNENDATTVIVLLLIGIFRGIHTGRHVLARSENT